MVKSRYIARIIVSSLIISFLITPNVGSAQTAPSISSITGTVNPGNILSINGSNLMNQQTTGWHNFFTSNPLRYNFDAPNGTLLSDTVFGGSSGYIRPNGALLAGSVSTNTKVIGTGSAYFHSLYLPPAPLPTQGGQGVSYQATASGTLTSLTGAGKTGYFSTYVRYNRGTSNGLDQWPGGVLKWIEIPWGGIYVQAHLPNGGPPPGTNPRFLGMYDVPNPTNTDKLMEYEADQSGIHSNRWYHIELLIKQPTNTGVKDGTFDAWIDGRKVSTNHPLGPNAANNGQILFGVVNGNGNRYWDIEAWMDQMTMSAQRVYPSAMVELANGTNYATATKVYQAPEYISDTRVDFKLNTTGLGTGPYYVFVTNNAQQRSSAIPLSGGTGPTPVMGDINLDHIVNAIDYSILNSDWFTNASRSDLNTDGIVNSLDYSILNSNWFKTW
jgi:hypothetical protein